MKTKILIPFLALAMLPMLATAQVNYAVSGDTAYVTNSPNASGSIVIASTYDGYPVTSIGNEAFEGCESLTSVTIPDSVTSIGDEAFDFCLNLTNITIPDSVTSIGGGAFAVCVSLTSVTIPDSVTSIGDYAFDDCESLTNITVDEANLFYSSTNGVLFDKDQATLIQFPTGLGGSYAIPDSVTNIEDYAFAGCGLTNVTIPDSVTSIGEDAFADCESLTSVIIPDSVTNIDGAFDQCSSLTSVTIPDSVTSIGEEAFAGCGLTSVTIPNSVTSIGEEAFYGCESLTNITIPDSVTSIGEEAFYNCTGLTSVIIGSGVTSIESQAFAECYSLTSVTIPDSVTNIEGGTFWACYSLTSITIPDSVTYLGDGAFEACESLTNVIIGNGVTAIIGEEPAFFISTFDGCTNLTSVTIGSGVTSIGDYAFDDCPLLTSVTFLGNAPTADAAIFGAGDVPDTNVTVYTVPGTTGWSSFASVVGVVTAPQFGSTAYGGSPVLFYPTNGAGNTLQLSTNPASGNWVTVSNAVTLAALQLTNAPSSAFFRLQSSGGSAPDAGLSFYLGQPVLFYPTNADYTPQMSTSLAAPDWTPPVGNAFISVQVTNAPPNAVFRLH